jgi:hypothetical protein
MSAQKLNSLHQNPSLPVNHYFYSTLRLSPKVRFKNKKQLLSSNNLSFEIKKKLIKSCICSVAHFGSQTRTLGEKEEKVVNAFETWCWRRMLKIKKT